MTSPTVSFEFFPPNTEKMAATLWRSVERLAPVHGKQLLTYLRLSGRKVGLLLNFGEARIKDGIERVINGVVDD